MQVHNLSKSGNKKHKRIGRGGKRGSYSGRGIKGQKARAGRRIRPQIRDIIKKIHKRRGYGKTRAKSVYAGKVKPAIVNLSALDKAFKDGERVTAESLIEKKLIKSKAPVKILGGGKLNKKLIFDENLSMSASVKKHVGKI